MTTPLEKRIERAEMYINQNPESKDRPFLELAVRLARKSLTRGRNDERISASKNLQRHLIYVGITT